MRSIKGRIMLIVLTTVLLLCMVFGAMSCFLNYRTALDVIEQSITQTALLAADRVSAEIRAMENTAVETGCTAQIASKSITFAEKKELIAQKSASFGFTRGNLLDVDGTSYFDGNNYAERDYFQAAMRGESYISDPTVSKVTGKVSFLVSAPVWEGGKPGTTVIGVVYFVPTETFLNDIVLNISVSPSGYAYILNKNGTSVADKDTTVVGIENSIEGAKTDASLADTAAIETRMINGENGFAEYNFEGKNWVQGFAPVPATNGWSIGVAAQESDFLGNFYLSMVLTLVLVCVALAIGTFSAIRFGKKIGDPIRACSERLMLLTHGNLASPVPVVNAKDETGELATATASIVNSLKMVVGDITHSLSEMANGNFDLQDLRVYEGDFEAVSTSANRIVASLNSTLRQIDLASEQVSGGAEQVSNGAQSLSQGATEQASSVEELSASIAEISEQVKRSAENATEANKVTMDAGNKLMVGNEDMLKLITAMDEIRGTSKHIGNIVKTINDIAFQTNILALNAAVEAARAGAAGKGFAVVADEVRSLASKSSEAVKDTAELIESSNRAVENGSGMADATADALKAVMVGAKQSVDLVALITVSLGEQANAISQVTMGVEQISGVVQTNSATSQESAAASEELNGQAQILKDLVSRFKLRKTAAESGRERRKEPVDEAYEETASKY